jgi:tRNA 5-methylaminomethyl-2-thiouridine biosynthesis bifunctional protein
LPLPVLEGLWISAGFGGRGLLWAVLAAESIASRLDAEPPLLERELSDAIDPRRFPKRRLRQAL